MRRKRIIFILALILTGTFAFCEGGPKIVFDHTSFDFGKVQRKTTVNHTFVFKNKGEATLKIDRVMRGCACATITLSSKEIPAGEEGKLKVQLNTDYSEGKETKTIYVYSNDPDNPVVELIIKADVLVPAR